MRDQLQDELDCIDQRLRVSPNIEMVLRAVDKEFSLCANYPKGHGEIFGKWMSKNHPGALLLHVERASGSRKDLCVEGSGALYWNRKYWIEFLDKQLRTPGDNILQENLFIILSSCEMTALARVCTIIHLSICLPTRWLAGNSHKLSDYDWSVRSMGQMIDLLEKALEEIEKDGTLIVNESFMMVIFNELIEKLPPFKEYIRHMYKSKKTSLVDEASTKVLPLSLLREEVFSPKTETNKSTSIFMKKLGELSASAILSELRNPSKATSNHLSSVNGKFSFSNTSCNNHLEGMGKMAVNDPAESSFGGTTRQIQYFGRIGITNAGGVDQVRRNGDLSRGFGKKTDKTGKLTQDHNKVGIFHEMPEQMIAALLTMAKEDSNITSTYDRQALSKQRAEKERKQQLMEDTQMKKAQEGLIDALYYHDMFGSAACWMNARQIDTELRKLTSNTAKIDALKENIRIRVIGLGWSDLATPWSRNGKLLTVDQLKVHLKMIIKEQRKRDIPSKPLVQLPKRKDLPILGTKTIDLTSIEIKSASTHDKFEEQTRCLRDEREINGVGDRYAHIQPMSRPNVDKSLVGKRLDICEKYDLEEGGSELRWSQGVVLSISDGSNMLKPGARTAMFKAREAVEIRWDANVKLNEPESTSFQRLLQNKWNPKGKHSEGCWRYDFNTE